MKVLFKKSLNYLVISFFLVFVFGSLIWYYYPIWTAGKVDYILARPGTIEYKVNVKATFANEEYPIYAPASGGISFTDNKIRRFRKGEVVGTVQVQGAASGQTVSVVTQEGGLFYKFIDGLEQVFSRDNLLNMELNSLIGQQGNMISTAAIVTSGSPIGKIVNNHKPTAAFLELPKDEGLGIEKLKVNQKIKLEVNDRAYEAKILRKSSQPLGVVVEFESFVEGSVENRVHEVVWNYKNSPEGILVPKESLWTQGEEKGVFVVAEGVIRFHRVKILDQNETTACVDGVSSGMIVITTPQKELDGLSWDLKNQ